MFKFLFYFVSILIVFSCKSSIKQRTDNIYSRHLQRHMPLTIITTTIPDKKEEMNLLLFNNRDMLENINAKKIIDSLYSKKLIKPLIVVAFEGINGDYGMEEENDIAAKQYKKFNEFVTDELYPFIKKKVVIRKFNSVAICGFGKAAISAFDIGWNNDEKIQKVGMFLPQIIKANKDKKIIIETIASLRKRPNLEIWITDNGRYDSSIIELHKTIKNKNSTTISTLINVTEKNTSKHFDDNNFASFLLWCYPR